MPVTIASELIWWYVNMVKQLISITLEDNVRVDDVKFNSSWKIKADFVDVINSFIRSGKLIEFYPLGSKKYVTVWRSKDDHIEFLENSFVISIFDTLRTNGIRVFWSDIIN